MPGYVTNNMKHLMKLEIFEIVTSTNKSDCDNPSVEKRFDSWSCFDLISIYSDAMGNINMI